MTAPTGPDAERLPEHQYFRLHVNGHDHDVADAWIGESLLFVLRERLGFAAAKGACEQGECGSCSVLVDGDLVCSCLVLAASAVGRDIVTVEGLSPDGTLTDVQRAFIDEGAVQCGFCTPGLIASVHDLLDRVPNPDEIDIREALSGNICRCTGYGRIVSAVQLAARTRTAAIDEELAALEDELDDLDDLEDELDDLDDLEDELDDLGDEPGDPA